MHQETGFLRQLAKSWNNLDTSFVESILADEMTYESQWVLTRMEGKESFLSYLHSKFHIIKTTMQIENMSVTAELATHPESGNKPCIVLTQTTDEVSRQASMFIEIENGKIKRIDLCFVPNPSAAILSGDIPMYVCKV